jgi:uncharacterized membrane protein
MVSFLLGMFFGVFFGVFFFALLQASNIRGGVQRETGSAMPPDHGFERVSGKPAF